MISANINKDNKLDLTVVNYDDSTVSLLLGYRNAKLKIGMTFLVGLNPESLILGDFNNEKSM